MTFFLQKELVGSGNYFVRIRLFIKALSFMVASFCNDYDIFPFIHHCIGFLTFNIVNHIFGCV